ncbi:cytochrome P450 [Amniculicola lignicola CBS 123094]|uniref:Cytochrome P450 n=1 Tax=Amniculicola lignicola CBS 123094 TaxID=1392246 RepID=A0A6A5W0Y6_9PLEO|nr:cytochrome P450 [Amniculicola lignicola CBS 123094]
MALSYFSIFSALTVLYGIFKLLRFGRREKHLPPGPPTYPIIGNAHLAVDKDLYKRFKDWSEQYGDVYSLKIGKGTMIVLNSKRAVYELIDKRSAIYSSRANDEQFRTALKNENIANMDADAGWRAQRKLTARFFAPAKLDGDLAKVSEAEITTLVHDLLISPEDFSKHVNRSNASFSAIALYGQRATSHDDFWATAVYEAMDVMNKAISPGTYLPSEQFPIFKLIPKRWNPAHARAEESFRFGTDLWTEAQKRVEARRNRGDKRISLMDEMLDDITQLDVSFRGTKLPNFVGALMQGAADTGALAMRTNIMFLATHPWVQDKAQKELDAVCGADRMPTWADFKDLPYINCIMKEGLRIRPVVPTGIPHACTEDNWYEGMLIPKDATIMIPHWALHHSQYDDPDTYNPDRYLNHPGLASEYAASQDYQNRDHYSYGAGRRICAGIQLAERTQFRMLSAMLWAFRLEHAIKKETGEEIPIDTEAFEDKLIAGPKPFKIRFTPRSPKHVEVIKRELENASGLLKQWE